MIRNQYLHLTQNRRSLVTSGLALTGMGLMSGCKPIRASQDFTDISDKDQFSNTIKLTGSLNAETVYVAYEGVLWGLHTNETPVPICGFQGLARSDWQPHFETGYIQTPFDIGYFSDLETKAPLETLVNPLTNETVSPFHFKYGGTPVHHTLGRFLTDQAPHQKWNQQAEKVWMSEMTTGSFPTPFNPTSWRRESSGQTFHVGSETTYVTQHSMMANSTRTNIPHTMFWSSVLSWEPWLLMGRAPGFVMWRGVGTKLSSFRQVPAHMRNYILKTQSNYFDAEPPWDGQISTYDDFKKLRKPQP